TGGGIMKVRDLDVNEFKALVQEAVEEKLEEIMGDPDKGLELDEKVIERLKRSLATTKRGERGIPIEKVAQKAGLEW
ncbi:MAG: hypothetical protein Q7R34_09995, partial [Dehalococcoidia bacterium]|nr:hypothetical protein [Dehalococcoidia bacterium]